MLLHPRHWPSWLLVGLIELLGRLPFALLWWLGQALGRLTYGFSGTRRLVARRNLECCLPDLDAGARESLLRAHFGWLGVAALTQGVGWSASRERLARLVRFRNREALEDALEAGEPMILLVPHFVGLELGGAAFTALVHPGAYMYQRIRNPVIEWRVRRARQRFGSLAFERQDDLRALVRVLRAGTPFFYLPDQDGGRRGLFVPLCGLSASTVPMLGRFAALGRARVIPTFAWFLPRGQGLELCFGEPLANFPSGDAETDSRRMNALIETAMREMPAQYFWVHRRFKTRPPGEPPLYPRRRR